jgi:hypothetical protein
MVSRLGITVGLGLNNFETWMLSARLVLRRGETAISIVFFSVKVIKINEPIRVINKISNRIVTRLNGDFFFQNLTEYILIRYPVDKPCGSYKILRPGS